MRPRPSQVGQDVGVSTTRFFESVGKDSEVSGVEFARRKGTLFVGSTSEVGHGRRQPGRDARDRAEMVAKDVRKQLALNRTLGTASLYPGIGCTKRCCPCYPDV